MRFATGWRERDDMKFKQPTINQPQQCQWIDGEPLAADSCKCLSPAIPGKPWCADHYVRVYRRLEAVAGEG